VTVKSWTYTGTGPESERSDHGPSGVREKIVREVERNTSLEQRAQG